MDMLLTALSQGKLCVIDVSQMRGSQSLILSGLILRRIFDRNQEEFTKFEPELFRLSLWLKSTICINEKVSGIRSLHCLGERRKEI